MSFEKTSLFEGAGSVLGDTKDSRISLYKKYIEENPNSCFEFAIDEEKDEVILKKYTQNDEEERTIEIPNFVNRIDGYPFKGVTQSLKVIYHGSESCLRVQSYLFADFLGEKLDLSEFDTTGAVYMNGLFAQCENLEELDLSNFNTSDVVSMEEMFDGCSSLCDLDLSSFNTSKVKNMDYMFNQCVSLNKLDLRHFDFSNVEDFKRVFRCGYMYKTFW